MATNQNRFTPSDKKEIFEILDGVNYKLRQIGSVHTDGMGLYFDDKSKEPKWHISISSDNDGYRLIYSEFSNKENEWVRKDGQTCKSFNDALSILKLYRKKLDNLGLEKAPPQKSIYFKYAIYDDNNFGANWYLTKTNEFSYFYCPQGSDYHEMRKLFLNSLALFDTAEEAKEYVYQNKKDIIWKNTVDIIQIKIEDESHYHFGRKSIIHIKNYNEDIDEYNMKIDGIDLYYNNNIIGQLGITKDRKYNGEISIVSNLSKKLIQSVMHYLYSTLRGVEWKKPTILSSPIEDKYFGYNPNDIYTDDIDVVYGSKTIGYCDTKDHQPTGEIRFKNGIDKNLKKAVLYKFNNNSIYNNIEWKEAGKMKESKSKIESHLAETFEKVIKELQTENLLESVNSFDLDFTGKGISIKLNEHDEPNQQNGSSSTPFLDVIYSLAEGYRIFDYIWPNEDDFFDEVAYAVGADYEDVKEVCGFDQLSDSDCLDFIKEHDGENVAKKIFGTIKNIQTSFDEFIKINFHDENNAFKKFIDYFNDDLNEYEEQHRRECVHDAIETMSQYCDDDDDYDDED